VERPRLLTAAISAAALASLLAGPAPAPAGAAPACAPAEPDETVEVRLRTFEGGRRAPLVATHHVSLAAEFTGAPVDISIRPAGAPVLRTRGRGDIAELVVPRVSSLRVKVSWRQSIGDFRREPASAADACSASRVVTLPVLPARRSRALVVRSTRQGSSSVALLPAATRPDRSPVRVSVRTTRSARYPSRRARPRTMEVPLREVDRSGYRRRLPSLAGIGEAERCRFYDITCGSVVSRARSVVRGDPGYTRGALLAFTQPSRRVARHGLRVDAGPGMTGAHGPHGFGYEIKIRQSGRLLARVRVAGRCARRGRAPTPPLRCRARRSTQLR
jgi:hypothetical protein